MIGVENEKQEGILCYCDSFSLPHVTEQNEKDFSFVEIPTVLQGDLALSALARCLGPQREQRVDFFNMKPEANIE